jgi:hypothetical protein
MADSFSRISDLYNDVTGPTLPLKKGDTDEEAVGYVQELLRGVRQQAAVPGWISVEESVVEGGETFGIFGGSTSSAVIKFKKAHNLKATADETVDHETIKKLVDLPHKTPVAGQAYLILRLGFKRTIWTRMMGWISAFEESARQGAFANAKKQDKNDAKFTGLSYGLLQWTFGSARLGELLQEMFDKNAPLFRSRLGLKGGPTVAGSSAAKLLDFANNNPKNNIDKDGNALAAFKDFNLQNATWRKKYKEAGLETDFQKVQVQLAEADLRDFFKRKNDNNIAKLLQSECGVVFFLDLSNQHGFASASARYDSAVTTVGGTPTEGVIMKQIEDDEKEKFQARRRFFRLILPDTLKLVSKTKPFDENA